MNIVLLVPPESISLIFLQQSCLNCLRYFWFETSLLKFEAILLLGSTTRCESREDVEYAAYAFPHQPFSKMFRMNKTFHFFEPLHNNVGLCLSCLKPAESKLCEQNASYLVRHSKLGPKNMTNFPYGTNCSKSTKMAIAVCKFSKIFRGSMPSDSPKVVFVI